MTFPANPQERSPKGDHNRRLSLGIEADDFAAQAGITVQELHDYESTGPDHEFRADIADAVGTTLEYAEAQRAGMVDNGPKPIPTLAERVRHPGDGSF